MLSRREILTAFLGAQFASVAGCSRHALPPKGELLSPNFDLGHRIRDRQLPPPSQDNIETVQVAIVGGGIAGLSAAWRLQQIGIEDFRVLELESTPGGTARSGRSGHFAYPWGAHYLPTPMVENQAIIDLLREMKVVEAVDEDGTPIVAEQYLCRDPEERVFHDGRWQEGLYPYEGASAEDLKQLGEFQDEVNRWVARRDSSNRRTFAIPVSRGSDDPEIMALDQESFAAWMDEKGWTSPRLRWLVDYSCRDDYGLSIEQTSAWAGLFYFASRIRESGDESQPVITWPEGNGRIVQHLANQCGNRLMHDQGVVEIRQDGSTSAVNLTVHDIVAQRSRIVRAERVIFAVPQFLAPHLIRGLDEQRVAAAKRFQYGSWLVANVHLSDRPPEDGFPMCWDNVIYGSKSLGYVCSTHQLGIDHGPTVWTWYYPFCDVDPKLSRQEMLSLGWAEWADLVLSDLETAHPSIRQLVTRVDVMRWGHAMVQPRVGFVSSPERREASKPAGLIHFAGTDLSGVALMEEALDHGVRAAEEVAKSIEAGSALST